MSLITLTPIDAPYDIKTNVLSIAHSIGFALPEKCFSHIKEVLE